MKQKSFSTVCSLIQAELSSLKSSHVFWIFCLTFRTRTSFVFIQLFETKFSISAKQQTSQHIFLPALLAVWSLDVLTEPTNLLLSLIWVLETEDVLRQSSDSSVIWRWALTHKHKQTDQNTNGWLGLLFWWFWHEETTETDRWNKVIWYLDLRRGLDYHDLILLLHIQVCDVFIMLWYETKRKWRPMKQRHLKQLFIKAFPFVHISLCRCSSASTEERSRVELRGGKSLKRSFRQKNLVLQLHLSRNLTGVSLTLLVLSLFIPLQRI